MSHSYKIMTAPLIAPEKNTTHILNYRKFSLLQDIDFIRHAIKAGRSKPVSKSHRSAIDALVYVYHSAVTLKKLVIHFGICFGSLALRNVNIFKKVGGKRL